MIIKLIFVTKPKLSLGLGHFRVQEVKTVLIVSICSWHNTWQLAVVLAEAMNRKVSISQADAEAMAIEVQRKNSAASMAK